MSIKIKNKKKTKLLTRIIKDKKGLYVSTAMKIVLSIVLGITTLTGSVLVVKDMVMPRTSEKIAEAFDNDYSSGAGGGGSGGGSTTTRNGAIPEGCSYTLADGTILNAGEEMPFAPTSGDVYTEGDYEYTYCKIEYPYPEAEEPLDVYGTEWTVTVNDRTKTSYKNILSEISGKPVTNMFQTFSSCKNLTTAPMIPDSVTELIDTFNCCRSLTTAPTIPDSVTVMFDTFDNCSSLATAPVIPNSVTNMESAFSGCESLTTAPVIPDSVTTMYGTFNGCTSLTAAPTIPDSVTDMSSTFYGCTSLTSAPVIPGSVTSMNRTFKGCTTLTGSLECNANPKYYNECLKGTQITSITGSCSDTIKNKLLATK